MPLNYLFLLRSVISNGCSIYLWRSVLVERRSKTDRVLRVIGALITLWLAVVAIGRGIEAFPLPVLILFCPVKKMQSETYKVVAILDKSR